MGLFSGSLCERVSITCSSGPVSILGGFVRAPYCDVNDLAYAM